MVHPLPPRPSTSYSSPPTTSTQPPPLPPPSPPTPGFCPICPSLPAPQISQPTKYTCPRCSIRTCSLQCSSLHKTLHNCSGERDKAKYVKMNEYGYREMMNDYVYLEQVGRRVKDWGGEIVKGGFDQSQNDTDRKGKGREFMTTTMRGQRVAARGKGPGKSKRELLKLKLEARDIYMELLPLGMERKKMNESTWDFKSQTAWLTIEFIFHPPNTNTNITPPLLPTTLVTHRNNISTTPLLKLVETHIQKSTSTSSKQPLPDWIHDLLPPLDSEDPDPPTPPLFLIRVSPPTTTTTQSSKRFYRPLPPNDPLLTSLRDVPFVEFPTIEVVDTDSTFDGVILQSDSQHPTEHRSPKRRKITVVDKAAMSGLLGGYGSSASDGEEKEKSALEGLGGYDSDEEDEEGEEGDVSLNPAALEELVKLARSAGGDEDDEVDWDDSDVE
ncbi:Box C/D snoRNA accumulation [Marasmius sp. AFHP31]|nr:Box C/D snoRNA accumulation [Marasmius sp. AFHP31]